MAVSGICTAADTAELYPLLEQNSGKINVAATSSVTNEIPES